MKKYKHDLTEPVDKQSYKKSYIQRKIQEKEAEELINDYLTDVRNPDRLDGLGRKRGQRS